MEIFFNKNAIVTGAASGIGRALSQELARRGAKVILADINSDLLKETAKSITVAGHKGKAAVCDVTDFAAVEKLVGDAVSDCGRLDYIFNNAGTCIIGEAKDHSYDDWCTVIDLNLYGVVHGVAAAYPTMVKQGFGHIVNTSSLSGIVPVAGEIAYTTSKYAVVGLSEALRVEGKLHGVKVSVVCQGLIKTPLYDTTKMLKLDRAKLVKSLPKAISPEKCSHHILRGVERNKAIILISPITKVFWRLQRLSPGLARWLIGVMTKRSLRIAMIQN